MNGIVSLDSEDALAH